MVRDGRLELPTSCSQSKRATNCANPGFLGIQFCSRCGQTCGQADFLTTFTCEGNACIAGVSRDCGHSIFRLEREASCSQSKRATNCANPGYSVSAIIPRREEKSKIFLPVVIPIAKTACVRHKTISILLKSGAKSRPCAQKKPRACRAIHLGQVNKKM